MKAEESARRDAAMLMRFAPRLLLLTGPAAQHRFRRIGVRYHLPGFTVRDYWRAPDLIAGGGGPPPVEPECGACNEWPPCECARYADAAIRSLPGGEAWLVGLVLPEAPFSKLYGASKWDTLHYQDPADPETAEVLRQVRAEVGVVLPSRLAIIAPHPPPVLVQRVRDWGGEVWWCADDPDTDQGVCFIGRVNGSPEPTPACPQDMVLAGRSDTWPEAVRAALGEVEP